MDTEYENHKKFRDHIWKITPTRKTRKDEPQKMKTRDNKDEEEKNDQ